MSLQPEVRDFEPREALDGGRSGLDLHPALVALAAERLRSGGTLALEVGIGQASMVAELMHSAGLTGVRTGCDLQGIERVVHGRKAE